MKCTPRFLLSLVCCPLLLCSGLASAFVVTDADVLNEDSLYVGPRDTIYVRAAGTMTLRVWGDWIENTARVRDSSRRIRASIVRNSVRNGFQHKDRSVARKGKGRIDIRLSNFGDFRRGRVQVTLSDRLSDKQQEIMVVFVTPAEVERLSSPQPVELGESFRTVDVRLSGSNFLGRIPRSANPPGGPIRVFLNPAVTNSTPQVFADGSQSVVNRLPRTIEGTLTSFSDSSLIARFELPRALNRGSFDFRLSNMMTGLGRIDEPSGFVHFDAAGFSRRFTVRGTRLLDRVLITDIRQASPGTAPAPGEEVTFTMVLNRPVRESDRAVIQPGPPRASARVPRPADNFRRQQAQAGRSRSLLRGDLILWQIDGGPFVAGTTTNYVPAGTTFEMNELPLRPGDVAKDVRLRLASCPQGAQPGRNFRVTVRALMHNAVANEEPLLIRREFAFQCPARN